MRDFIGGEPRAVIMDFENAVLLAEASNFFGKYFNFKNGRVIGRLVFKGISFQSLRFKGYCPPERLPNLVNT